MDWIKVGTWELVGVIVATLILTLQLFPLFSSTNKGLENYSKPNSAGISEKLLNGVKNNRWRLSGIAIIIISLVAGITQKSILFGLSTCATLNYLLSFIDRSYMESIIGSNRFMANLFLGFYSTGAFLLMIFFWFLTSKFR